MVKKLKRRFILAAQLSFTIVLLILLFFINSVVIIGTLSKSDASIDNIASRSNIPISSLNKFLFEFSDNSSSYQQNIYIKNIYFKKTDFNYTEIRPADYFTNESIDYLMSKAKGHKDGMVGSFRFKVYDFDDSIVTVFADVSKDIYLAKSFAFYSILGFVACEFIVFILLYIFSKKAINPIVENIENQRNFIDSASHELKTPISVIAANNEIHEMKYGNTKWSESTKRQVDRINKLVNQMLKLSRYEEDSNPTLVYEKLDMTELIRPALANLESIILNKHINIENNLTKFEIIADKAMMKELVEIILENAVKYCLEGGKIILDNSERCIEFLNSSTPVSKEDTHKIFEKFYRTDKARSRNTGGNGMGLSIAKAISNLNNLKISASYENSFFKIKLSIY